MAWANFVANVAFDDARLRGIELAALERTDP
jgi:hypothetical protein